MYRNAIFLLKKLNFDLIRCVCFYFILFYLLLNFYCLPVVVDDVKSLMSCHHTGSPGNIQQRFSLNITPLSLPACFLTPGIVIYDASKGLKSYN